MTNALRTKLGVGVALVMLTSWAGCVASGIVEERPDAPLPEAGSGPGLFEPPDAEGPCPIRCSSDLRGAEDCRGNVVLACKDGEGCLDNACVSACKAAEAAQGTLGCDFFVASVAFEHTFGAAIPGTCATVMVANGGRLPVSITATYEGRPVDLTPHGRIARARGATLEYEPMPADGAIPPEGIVAFFLRQDRDGVCPAPPHSTGPMLKGTGFGTSYRIQTSQPVTAYSVLPGLTLTTSLALLYPAASWGTSYVAAVSEMGAEERALRNLAAASGDDKGAIILVAREPSTVLVTPSKDLVGNQDAGVRSVAKGSSRHFTLEAGGVLQLSQEDNLSGTVVISDKPIGMLTGSTSYQHIGRHHQLPPVRAIGRRYAAIRPGDRDLRFPEKHGWRFVGIVDGTKLSYQPGPPPDAPVEIGPGTVVEIETTDRFVVESQDEQHPFLLLEGTRRAVGTTSDIFYESVPAVSLEQFVSGQIFYTVPGFEKGHLVVVREADRGGVFHPVELDCLGAITGWESIDAAGHYQYALVDTPLFDFDKQTTVCELGRRSMRSTAPFGVTVWGWRGAQTYAYPAAAGLRVLNQVDVGVR